MAFMLKEGLLLGAATAATQIEGGDCGHSWNDWYRKGRISDGSDPARANDHYTRWKADADLMAEMGIKVCRMGIEWARLFPREGQADLRAAAHYREEIEYLQGKGIKVLLTLHHFTNSMWFEEKGGFSKKENIKHYLELVEFAVRLLGDIVNEFITINEPNVYATHSYITAAASGEKQ
jgi:beta-glucosidase